MAILIKAILFDIGSTLIVPRPQIDGMFHRVATERGHRISLADASQHLSTVDAFYEEEYLRDGDFWCSPQGSIEMYLEMYRYLSELCGIHDDANGIAQQMHDEYLKASNWEILPDVLSCLKMLKRKHLRLGVVSNWSNNLESLLRDLMLHPYFEEVIASAVVGYRKPNPVIFDLMLERMKLSSNEVIHVGDRYDADGIGAANAGIKPVIIDRENRYRDSLYPCIGSLNELSDFIGS